MGLFFFFFKFKPWQRVEARSPVGVCAGCPFEAPMAVQWKANIVSIPKIPFVCGCVWWGALSSSWDSMFDSRREGLSLQTAVCSTASSSASNSISMQSNHQMRHCTCDIFNHACAMSPWIVISVRQLDGWLALKFLRNLSGMNPIGFQTPLRFLLPPPWEWYFSFFSEIFGQLVDILHRNLL